MKRKGILAIVVVLIVSLFAVFYYNNYKYQFNNSDSGAFCGGILGIECPAGFICNIQDNSPDAGGTCVFRPLTWIKWNVLNR